MAGPSAGTDRHLLARAPGHRHFKRMFDFSLASTLGSPSRSCSRASSGDRVDGPDQSANPTLIVEFHVVLVAQYIPGSRYARNIRSLRRPQRDDENRVHNIRKEIVLQKARRGGWPEKWRCIVRAPHDFKSLQIPGLPPTSPT